MFYQTMVWYSKDEIPYEAIAHNFYTVLKQLPAQFFLDQDLKNIWEDKTPYGSGAYEIFTINMHEASMRLLRERQAKRLSGQ